jgi:hypothetical protein
VKIRADVLSWDPKVKKFVYIESKWSPKAPFQKNQKKVIPELVKSGDDGLRARVGKRSGSLAEGDEIQVIFQPDIWSGTHTGTYGRIHAI